ncbi:hypothetical protein FMEXI_5075 [Fusarium mexicanum]|uniref:Uncharacterized protein n=1 Tax=Fusarium mexicanum TaxID=751941 RepID=A0A8H5N0F2_9HYPO|nr:hypothetical protein FMEXI_5075 [Fusarium mexicanum]
MADESIKNIGDNSLKRSLPPDSSHIEQDVLADLLNVCQQRGVLTLSNGRWSEITQTGTDSGIHLHGRQSPARASVQGAPGPSPRHSSSTRFSARNMDEWMAIWDKYEQEGRGLQGALRSFDTSDPNIHKTVQGVLFDTNVTVLEAVEAKKRRVGNTLCNLFEGLPDVPDLSEPSQPASTRLRPRPTIAGPSSRQQQLALPPDDPRETAGEPSSRQQESAILPVDPRDSAAEPSGHAGGGSVGGQGGVREAKSKQAEDVDTGLSAYASRSRIMEKALMDMPGVLVELSPEEPENTSDEESEQESEEEEDDEVVGKD